MSQEAAYRINGREVAAQAFYAAACDPRRSVAVEACAGAGKTWMLISRIVRALLDEDEAGAVCQPQEILAITFTRKAAGEMSQRLHEWLEEFSRADDASLILALRQRGVAGLEDPDRANRLCVRLRGLYARLLASGQSIEFRTFHAWFATLLRMAPAAVLEQMRLPLRYELLEDDSGAMEAVWPRFLQALVDQPERRADFEALVRQYGRHQTRKALEAVLARRTEFERADAAGVVAQSVRRFQEQFPRFGELDEVSAVLSLQAQAACLRAAAAVLQGLDAKGSAEKGRQLETALQEGDLDGVLGSLLTQKDTPRQFGKAQSDPDVRQAVSLATELLEMRRQDQAWHFQQRMTALARVLIGQYRSLKRERGWIDMQDVEGAAFELLSDERISGWIQERLDATVRHLLVDEFQDTNPLQWQALKSWLSSYAGASRAISVFLVGDPKQSIYRFRRAEPQVWRDAIAFIAQAFEAQLLSCDHTRRNSRAVLEAVNRVMAEAASSGAYPDYRIHTSTSEHAGQVLTLPAVPPLELVPGQADAALSWRDSLLEPRWQPEEKQRDREAVQAAAWLAAHLREQGLSPGEVMVLSRKRDNLRPLQEALLAHGVPADIDESVDLMECCEVQDLVALLDVLVSPGHDLSLARVLRSPLFGWDSQDLLAVSESARQSGRPWLAVLQDCAAGSPEDSREKSLWQSAGAVLARWQTWVRRLPPHDALQAIFEDGDVRARYARAAPPLQRNAILARLQALLTQSMAVEGGRYLTAYGLVRAFRAGRIRAPAVSSGQAVRLLTIHSAKGLEADTVLILNADAPNRRAESMGLLIQWPSEQIHPTRFVFLISESRPPLCGRDLLQGEMSAQDREELNLMYVAMTRACRTLVLSSCEPSRDSSLSLWKRLSPHVAQALLPNELADRQGGPAAMTFMLAELPPVPASPQTPEPPSPADPDLQARALIGQAMHCLLEWGGAGEPQMDAVRRQFGLDQSQCLQAAEAARRILIGEGAWLWHGDRLTWQGNEVELVYQGRLQRIDRLVQDRDGTWWVVDFKSHASPQDQPALAQQLRTYVRAVEALNPGQPVRAVFLTAQGRLIDLPQDV